MQSAVRTSSSVSTPFGGARTPVLRVAPFTPAPQSRDVVAEAKKKGVRLIVTLECTESKKEGATPSRYVTQKNRKNTPERLELKKYNPNLKRYTLHKEVK